MKAIIKCSQCDKEKDADAYTSSWQYKKKVCNYCKNYKKINPAEIIVANGKDKKVNCLKCGQGFTGRTNVRICLECKTYSDYNTDQFIQWYMLGV